VIERRRRLHRTLVEVEEQAAAEFLEAIASGSDPENVHRLLDVATAISTLRRSFAAGTRDEALASG